ncbi:MAG TPA: alpha/beta fold hydrolase [Bacteroidales bacterium]|jgi:pimeloyl-ACP methyl ester carboxylesterase|nr:alpha/beta fold hydrolase [Bacteroidales bacterium]
MKKHSAFFLLVIISSVLGSSYCQDQVSKTSIVGSWIGRVDVSSVFLRVVFNISLSDNDSLLVALDSPDQGAKDIRVGPLAISGNQISIKAPLLLAEYTGTVKNDTLIEGSLKQAGRTFPLILTKTAKPYTINRPQEPRPPFPYKSDDIKFRNEKARITLGGTVTIPDGPGPFPAVVLITGSGSQNRDEELMAHKPFWVIADYLSGNGIAVLRYDDRGVGQSENTSAPSTSADFATDAVAALNYLKTVGKIDTSAIGLAGHSEGGLIAAIAASSNPGTAFVISLAGPGVSGEQILCRQNYDLNKAAGMNKKELKALISMSRRMYAVIKKEPDNDKAAEEMAAILKRSMEKQKVPAVEVEKALKGFPASAATLTSPWYRNFIVTDPASYWKKVKCPVLALNGEKDLQVAADISLPAIEKAVRSGGNQKVTAIAFTGLNHLFQHCKTGLPAEYGEIEETFSPEVLKTMADWINGL